MTTNRDFFLFLIRLRGVKVHKINITFRKNGEYENEEISELTDLKNLE
jgi:hypothetical protein